MFQLPRAAPRSPLQRWVRWYMTNAHFENSTHVPMGTFPCQAHAGKPLSALVKDARL